MNLIALYGTHAHASREFQSTPWTRNLNLGPPLKTLKTANRENSHKSTVAEKTKSRDAPDLDTLVKRAWISDIRP